MSGFEVAGIVLGALPLLIEGAKATKFYLQGIERWWQFETDFEAFVRAITFEDVIFTQNLDLLLLPLDLSDNERNSLKASSKSSLWRHPDIVAQLKHHLREALPLFTRLLNELRISLDELHEMIPVKNAWTPSNPVQDEILKLCISFCRRRQPVLDSASKANQQLERILRNAHDIQSAAQAPSFGHGRDNSTSKDVDRFIKLQRQSQVLYSALKAGLNCHCNEQHRCGLDGSWKLQIGRSLNVKNEPAEVVENGELAPVPTSTFLAVTDTEMSNKKRPWTNKFRELTKPKRLLKPMSKGPSNSSAEEGQDEQVPFVKKPAPQLAPNIAQHRNGGKDPRRGSQYIFKAKSGKAAVIADICSLIKAPQSDVVSLGLINAEHHDVKFFLEPKSQRRLQEAQTQTIEMFWSSSSMNLTARLQIGISIATVLLGVGTSAWVPRGWNWEDIFVMRSKEKGPGQDWMFGPYMDHKSLSLALKEIPMNAKDHAEAAIFSLGVLLMELHFRQGLENSPHWHRHCPGGQPNDLTNIATAYAWHQDLEKDPGLVEGLAEPVDTVINNFGKAQNAPPEVCAFSRSVRRVFTLLVHLDLFLSQDSPLADPFRQEEGQAIVITLANCIKILQLSDPKNDGMVTGVAKGVWLLENSKFLVENKSRIDKFYTQTLVVDVPKWLGTKAAYDQLLSRKSCKISFLELSQRLDSISEKVTQYRATKQEEEAEEILNDIDYKLQECWKDIGLWSAEYAAEYAVPAKSEPVMPFDR
ncbi:hypothetical protein CEP53_013606 [Fusarium sp. AF-6]|nr:hypothetical protein CEP53_013606 [Fusarium sp. AF-6]